MLFFGILIPLGLVKILIRYQDAHLNFELAENGSACQTKPIVEIWVHKIRRMSFQTCIS